MIKMSMEPRAPSGDEQRRESRSSDLRQSTKSSHWDGRAETRAERVIAAERTSAAGPTTTVRRRAKPTGDIATSKADRRYCHEQNKRKSKRKNKRQSKRQSKRESKRKQAQNFKIIK